MKSLEYLSRLDSVAWHEVKGNNVYTGFDSPPPEEWKLMAHAAAIWGNKATGAEFHAWAVAGHPKGWRPSDDGSTLAKLTTRNMKSVE